MSLYSLQVPGVSPQRTDELRQILTARGPGGAASVSIAKLRRFFNGANKPGFLACALYLKDVAEQRAAEDVDARVQAVTGAAYLARAIYRGFTDRPTYESLDVIRQDCTERVAEILSEECGCDSCCVTSEKIRRHRQGLRPPLVNSHAVNCPAHETLTHLHAHSVVGTGARPGLTSIPALLLTPDDLFDFSAPVRRELAVLISCLHLCYAYALLRADILQDLESAQAAVHEAAQELDIDVSQGNGSVLQAVRARETEPNSDHSLYLTVDEHRVMADTRSKLCRATAPDAELEPTLKALILASLGQAAWLAPLVAEPVPPLLNKPQLIPPPRGAKIHRQKSEATEILPLFTKHCAVYEEPEPALDAPDNFHIETSDEEDGDWVSESGLMWDEPDSGDELKFMGIEEFTDRLEEPVFEEEVSVSAPSSKSKEKRSRGKPLDVYYRENV